MNPAQAGLRVRPSMVGHAIAKRDDAATPRKRASVWGA